jgi:hypothetical protein
MANGTNGATVPAQADKAETGRKMQRSPKYPGISVETAIERARTFHGHERRNGANVSVALKHWELNEKSSTAAITVAALVAYGLMVDSGSGKERRLQLSELALRIVLDTRQVSPERDQAIKDAALKPKMHASLWKKWGVDLPSDDNLRHALIWDWKFNENSVDAFIRQYRATISFAKLTSTDKLSVDANDSEETGGEVSPLQIGDHVQWESQGVSQFQQPRRLTGLSPDGQYAFVEGSSTGMPIGELTVVDPPSSEKDKHPLAPPPPNTVKYPPPGAPGTPAKMRSYSWALSGEFSAALNLFGEAHTEEDIDALADYMEITIKALKRSLKAANKIGAGE